METKSSDKSTQTVCQDRQVFQKFSNWVAQRGGACVKQPRDSEDKAGQAATNQPEDDGDVVVAMPHNEFSQASCKFGDDVRHWNISQDGEFMTRRLSWPKHKIRTKTLADTMDAKQTTTTTTSTTTNIVSHSSVGQRALRVLSLNSDGSNGIGVLCQLRMLEESDVKILDDFDILCGVGSGALIAQMLHAGFTTEQIEMVFLKVSARIKERDSEITLKETETVVLKQVLDEELAETLTARIERLKQLHQLPWCTFAVSDLKYTPPMAQWMTREQRFPRTPEECKLAENDVTKALPPTVNAMMASCVMNSVVDVPGVGPCATGTLICNGALDFAQVVARKHCGGREIGLVVEIGTWDEPMKYEPQGATTVTPEEMLDIARCLKISGARLCGRDSLEMQTPWTHLSSSTYQLGPGLHSGWRHADALQWLARLQMETPEKLIDLLGIALTVAE